jgi:hypothetical protein
MKKIQAAALVLTAATFLSTATQAAEVHRPERRDRALQGGGQQVRLDRLVIARGATAARRRRPRACAAPCRALRRAVGMRS